MLITAIEEIKSGRVRVVTDSGIRFPLYKKECSCYGLQENMELSDELYQEICSTILQKRARKRLLYILQRSDRTEYQLRCKLEEDGYPKELVDDAIAYVKSFHYVDDLRYACTYIRYHQNEKTRRQLQQTLYQKGVSSDLIEQAFDQEYQADEDAMIQALLQKRHYDPQTADTRQKAKMYQYLARKGFSSSSIRKFTET